MTAYFDLARPSYPPVGASCQVAEALCGMYLALGTAFPTETLYVAPICAEPWGPSVTYSAGPSPTYVVASTANEFRVNRHVYICTTAGTSGSTEPTWNQALGGTTTDGSVVWTECWFIFSAGTFTGAEPTGDSNYARAPIDNQFVVLNPSTGNTAAEWPLTAGAWNGLMVGLFVSDAATGGNIYAWGLLAQAAEVGSGVAPALGAGQPTLSPVLVGYAQAGLTLGTSLSISGYSVQGKNHALHLGIIMLSGTETISSITDTASGTWDFVCSSEYQVGSTTLVVVKWYERSAPLGSTGSFSVTITAGGSAIFGATLFEVANSGTVTQIGASDGTTTGGSAPLSAYPVLVPSSLVIVTVGIGGTVLLPGQSTVNNPDIENWDALTPLVYNGQIVGPVLYAVISGSAKATGWNITTGGVTQYYAINEVAIAPAAGPVQ